MSWIKFFSLLIIPSLLVFTGSILLSIFSIFLIFSHYD